jgi:hypothetical protein
MRHNRTVISGSVLWTPAADHVVDLAESAAAPVLEFAALVPIDLTESHGIEITTARLQEMVAAYDPAVEMASLNLDHNWGGPSLGWCEKVWLQDEALWVRYTDLDPSAIELIRTKRYTRRSAELALGHPVTGGWYFTGCALLGNARPAVAGLPPVTLCRPQYVLSEKETITMTVTPPTPGATPAPSAPAPADADFAILRSQVDESALALTQILREKAEVDADRRLAALGSRVTTAMAKLARPLLVELFAQRQPVTVKLQLDPAKPPADLSIGELLLQILSAVPPVEALTSARLADEDPAAVPLTGRLSADRRQELDAKYGFSKTAFGYRNN